MGSRASRTASLVSAACVLAAAGCATGGPPPPSELVLRRDLEVPAQRARAVFQGGAQVGSADRYELHCELEIATLADAPQRLPAGRFAVTRVTRRAVADPDTGTPPRLDLFADQDVFYETHLWLSGARAPAVRKLVCRNWTQSFGRGGYPGPEQIRRALGEGFALR
jgi:hypothetical protein